MHKCMCCRFMYVFLQGREIWRFTKYIRTTCTSLCIPYILVRNIYYENHRMRIRCIHLSILSHCCSFVSGMSLRLKISSAKHPSQSRYSLSYLRLRLVMIIIRHFSDNLRTSVPRAPTKCNFILKSSRSFKRN